MREKESIVNISPLNLMDPTNYAITIEIKSNVRFVPGKHVFYNTHRWLCLESELVEINSDGRHIYFCLLARCLKLTPSTEGMTEQ